MVKKFLAIGELLWDILPDERKLGGAPANLAYRLTQLGNPTWLLTRVGNDSDGRMALKILKNHGFNTELIQKDFNHPTGTVNVYFDDYMNPDYTINRPAAYDFISGDEKLGQLAGSIDCVVYGTLVQRTEQTALTLLKLIDSAENALKFCDINLRKECYNLQIIERSLNKATVVKLNHHEVLELGSLPGINEKQLIPVIRRLVEIYPLDTCLVTLEDEGALALDKTGNIYYSPGFNVNMEDPLGAGDAFSAAFLNEFLKSGDIIKSLDSGNLFGAMVVGQKGAMQPITREMTASFITSHKGRKVKEEYREFWKSGPL
ncbi:MAG: PfkB family carbohydrate kinase [Bacteroidales bacterium]